MTHFKSACIFSDILISTNFFFIKKTHYSQKFELKQSFDDEILAALIHLFKAPRKLLSKNTVYYLLLMENAMLHTLRKNSQNWIFCRILQTIWNNISVLISNESYNDNLRKKLSAFFSIKISAKWVKKNKNGFWFNQKHLFRIFSFTLSFKKVWLIFNPLIVEVFEVALTFSTQK